MNKLFFPVILIVAFACNNGDRQAPDSRANGYENKPATREDSLFREVMNGHDSGMARMGKLIGYQKQVGHVLDSVKALPAKQAGSADIASLESLLKMLKEAETGMNRWMEEFKLDSAAEDPERRMRYLLSEKDRVGGVNLRIREALRTADSVLKGNLKKGD